VETGSTAKQQGFVCASDESKSAFLKGQKIEGRMKILFFAAAVPRGTDWQGGNE
jgi:hypothetical protein